MKGTYLLIFRILEPVKIKTKAKIFRLPPGRYCYIGSAFSGPKRIIRHLLARKKKHWHIDYLLEHAEVEAIYLIGEKIEKTLAQKFGGVPIIGFGSSDSKAKSHLFLLEIFDQKSDGKQY